MTSLMAQETRAASELLASQIANNEKRIESIVETIREIEPSLVFMIGRGSSDHAAVFGKYLIETEVGVPVAFAAPSVSSVFNRSLQLNKAVAIVISQSGKSPDLLQQAQAAKDSGAYLIAIVNDETSPLANLVDAVIPIAVGPELAVAATKSYLGTLTALLSLVATWKQDENLKQSLRSLPEHLNAVMQQETQLKLEQLQGLAHCVVLGRGFGYAIAREIALKLKEVCSIHAEAFSSAEFVHGPVTLVENKLAIINVEIQDESVANHREQIADMDRRGATLFKLCHDSSVLHPRVLPLLVMLRFYLDIEAVATSQGLNPDAPPGLNKVTETV